MAKENLTWGELKQFANSLPENFMNEEVRWWGEDRGGKVTSTMKLEEDFINTDEGLEPKSAYVDDTTFTKEELEEMPVLGAGTPLLYVD